MIMRKKILCFATVRGTDGLGGHYNSLDTISEAMSTCCDIRIVTIGTNPSLLLVKNKNFYRHVFFNTFDYRPVISQIKNIIQDYNPDVLHFFDYSYMLIFPFIRDENYKVVVTKCGGVNDRTIVAKNLTLFSEENYDFYRSLNTYRNANLALIPNRAKKLELKGVVNCKEKDDTCFTIVRVCRIGGYYYKSIADTINLIEILSEKVSHPIKFVLIGFIYNQEYYDAIVDRLNASGINYEILTEDIYTTGASKMLYLADAVVVTGRSTMEAASLGLPLLAINSKDDIPVLINESNFRDLFTTNFSERGNIQNYDRSANIEQIEKLIADRQSYDHCSQFSTECFEKYFNVENAVPAYLDFYDRAEVSHMVSFKTVGSFLRLYFLYCRTNGNAIIGFLLWARRRVFNLIK